MEPDWAHHHELSRHRAVVSYIFMEFAIAHHHHETTRHRRTVSHAFVRFLITHHHEPCLILTEPGQPRPPPPHYIYIYLKLVEETCFIYLVIA